MQQDWTYCLTYWTYLLTYYLTYSVYWIWSHIFTYFAYCFAYCAYYFTYFLTYSAYWINDILCIFRIFINILFYILFCILVLWILSYFAYYAYHWHIILHFILHIKLQIIHIVHFACCAYWTYLFIASGYAPSYAPGNTYHAYFLTYYAYYFLYLLTYFAYWSDNILCIFCIFVNIFHNNLNIMHVLHIVLFWSYFTYFAYFEYKSHSSVFRCLFPLLLGPPSKGPAVHVPPPTSIATVLIFVTRCSRKVWLFSSHGIVPFSPTGTTGRRPSMELTGMTYNTCACSLRS